MRVLLAALLLLPFTAEAKSGLYLGFNIGGGIVSGDAPIGFPQSELNKDPDFVNGGNSQILFSTDEGGGFSAGFRLGYNILGFAAVEASFSGSGNNLGDSNKIEGQGGIAGLVRFFPGQLIEPDRWWDPYVFFGAGVHFIGYSPLARGDLPMQNDGRAWWPGYTINYGLGCDFYLVPFFSVGVDLAFANAFHDTFHIDDKQGIEATPTETASAFIFNPTMKLTFHFF